MILELLIFILLIVTLYYVYSYKKLHWHFKNHDLKFLPGVPIFGNIFDSTFFRKHYMDDLNEVCNKFPKERYMGFVEFTTPVILIRDPDIIKNVTVKDFNHFTDHRAFFSPELDPILYESLFFMKGEKWHNMRSTLSPAFTTYKMKYMLPFLLEISNNIVDYLDKNQEEDVDVDDIIHRYTNDVIASAGFGLHVNSVKNKDNDFFKIGKYIFDFNLRKRVILVLINKFPALGKIICRHLYTKRVYKFFSSIVVSTIAYRKQYNTERLDMIELLSEAKEDWTPDELTSQVFLFFIAAYETSASTLTMALHELALNPDTQDKLYDECKRFKDKVITFENMSELKYLDAVVNETLRKWCPAIILDRTCTKEYILPPPRLGGKPYVVKPGEIVYSVVNQLQMDSKYWPEPHKFDPDRFLEENKHKIKPFTFMPFGVGPRYCIGMRFAILEIKILLYHLILKFKIVKTAKTMDPIEIKPHNFIIKAAKGTHVRFVERILE